MIRHSCLRHWLVLVLGLALLGGCTTTHPSTLPTDAPLILDIRTKYCELSPDGAAVAVHEQPIPGFTLYDLVTGNAMAFAPRRGMFGLWLDATTWFEYTARIRVGTTYEPTDGWIVDLSRGTVTDTMTLDPVQRDGVLRDVKTLLSTYNARREAGQVSPDGRYTVFGGTIFEHTGPQKGQVKNHMDSSRGTTGCIFGWKADSSGYYFIEHGESWFGNPPGPIRFLPVTP